MSAPTAIRGGTAPLAALTAVFTPPCPTSWLITTTWLLSQYPAFPTTGPASCDPPSWSANIAKAGFNYYSPAICPHGFTVGPSCGITKTRTAEGFPAVAPGETAVYCVPIGLTCTTDTSDFRGGVWGFARDATTSGALVTVGPALQIRWVDADLTMLETHPLTPGLKLARTETRTETTVVPAIVRSTATTGPVTTTTTRQQQQPTSVDSQRSSATLVTDTKTVRVEETISLIFETGDPTTSLGPSNTAAGNSNGGGLGSLDRGTSIAVIVVVTVVAGILLWTAAFLFIRRYKKRAEKRKAPGSRGTMGDGAIVEEQASSAGAKAMAMASPVSELDANPPAVGSTPNPAELEGDITIQPPLRPWMHQRSWLRSPSMHPPQYSPRSMLSTRSRRTVRESFGEKINDPAAVLGRLKIPNPLSAGRPSPSSASPRGGSFWRLPRSPRSPSAAAGLSAQLARPSPRPGMSGNASRASTSGRGWQEGFRSKQADATP